MSYKLAMIKGEVYPGVVCLPNDDHIFFNQPSTSKLDFTAGVTSWSAVVAVSESMAIIRGASVDMHVGETPQASPVLSSAAIT